MMERWNELAKARMKALGITQEKLAEHLEITPGAVSHWLNARRSPELEEIAHILHYLNINDFKVSKDGLIIPPGDSFPFSGSCKKIQCYPLVSKEVIVNNFNDLVKNTSDIIASEWIESGAIILGQGFWFKVEGDSMLATSGLSIPSGSLVLFDSGRPAVHNDLILTLAPNGQDLSFKQLVYDGGKKFLAALNPRWPLVEFDETYKVLGVAIESKIKFR